MKEVNDDNYNILGTIGSDLSVSHDIWKTTTGNKYSFYANYEWNTTTPRGASSSVKNDKIGIALPSGWDIIAGSDQCKEFQSSGVGTPVEKGNCNGGLYEADFYGYAWSLTRTAHVFHSGWVNLEANRTGTAKIEAISEYAQAKNNSTPFSVGWGPLSITFQSTDNINKKSWHTQQ